MLAITMGVGPFIDDRELFGWGDWKQIISAIVFNHILFIDLIPILTEITIVFSNTSLLKLIYFMRRLRHMLLPGHSKSIQLIIDFINP